MNTLDSLRTVLALATLTSFASGCASTRDAYLYDRTTSAKGSLVFQYARSTHGDVVAQLSDGERCTGNFNTIPDAVEMDDAPPTTSEFRRPDCSFHGRAEAFVE